MTRRSTLLPTVSARRLTVILLVALVAGALHSEAAIAAPTPGEITSVGPLTKIATSTDLRCEVRHASYFNALFSADNDCGTFVAVDGELYGSQTNAPISNLQAFTPVSQAAVTGDGTSALPYTLVTNVALGTTGITVTQTDRYVSGESFYSTEITVGNATDTAKDVTLYRAADCRIEDELGYGYRDGSSIGCRESTSSLPSVQTMNVLEWIPEAGVPSQHREGFFAYIWGNIENKTPFSGECQCSHYTDNGAGLSWQFQIPPSGQATRRHQFGVSQRAMTRAVSAAPSVSKVTFGGSAKLKGRIAGTDQGVPAGCFQNEAITILSDPAGGSTAFSPIGQATSAADGTYSYAIKPSVSARYQVRLAETAECGAASSGVHSVSVAKKVTLKPSSSRVRKGTRVKFAAKVGPCAGNVGQTVTLEKKAGRWKKVAAAKLSSTCVATFRYRVTSRSIYRARVGGDVDQAGGTSRTVTIRIR